MTKQVAVYSAGGFGREVAWMLSESAEAAGQSLMGYIEDDEAMHGQTVNDLEVMSPAQLAERAPGCQVACAVGAPHVRRIIAEKCEKLGLDVLTFIDRDARVSPHVEIGEGSIICAGNLITVNITLGKHVHINLDCTIGHDVIIGDFTTLSPGVHVSGNVHIGKDVYIGTGANIINGTSDNPLVIGDGTVIAAGACVTKSADANALYAGVPAVRKK